MLDRFIAFPHIIETITESFLFNDLLNRALVNHGCNDAVSPVLYLDVITYHVHLSPEAYNMRYATTHFNTPESLQAVRKHSRHIRASPARVLAAFSQSSQSWLFQPA